MDEKPQSSKVASVEFVNTLTTQVDRGKLDSMLDMQRDALSRFEKTNEMLTNCCTLSAGRLNAAKKDLGLYSLMILDMKKDLDSIFRRLKAHKQNFAQAYPEAFAKSLEVVNQRFQLDDEEEENDASGEKKDS